MLRAILNKTRRQQPTKQRLYDHLPPITKTIQVRRTRHVGHCCRSRDELTSAELQWIPSHGRAKAGRPARTYIQQLCVDTGCSLEDLPEAMDGREGSWERVRNIRADGGTWWWWWWWLHIDWTLSETDDHKRIVRIPKGPAFLEHHHQNVYFHFQVNCWGSYLPLSRCSRCIL